MKRTHLLFCLIFLAAFVLAGCAETKPETDSAESADLAESTVKKADSTVHLPEKLPAGMEEQMVHFPDKCERTGRPVGTGEIVGFFMLYEARYAYDAPGYPADLSAFVFEVYPHEILAVIAREGMGWQIESEISVFKDNDYGWIDISGGTWCDPE
jgi:hypothetical protein